MRHADGTALDERLAQLEVDPADVDALITSHLHFDHAGGCALLPDARLVVQRAEWDEAIAVDDGHRRTARPTSTAATIASSSTASTTCSATAEPC